MPPLPHISVVHGLSVYVSLTTAVPLNERQKPVDPLTVNCIFVAARLLPVEPPERQERLNEPLTGFVYVHC